MLGDKVVDTRSECKPRFTVLTLSHKRRRNENQAFFLLSLSLLQLSNHYAQTIVFSRQFQGVHLPIQKETTHLVLEVPKILSSTLPNNSQP